MLLRIDRRRLFEASWEMGVCGYGRMMNDVIRETIFTAANADL